MRSSIRQVAARPGHGDARDAPRHAAVRRQRALWGGLGLALLAVVIDAQAGRAQMTFTCAAAERNCTDRILDNEPGGVSASITVPSGACASIADVNVAMQVQHTWVGDLVATLAHRGTTKAVTLMARPGLPGETSFGCPGEDVDVLFDDDVESPAQTACDKLIPAITGSRRPPPVGCPLYLTSDTTRFAYSCNFRGSWNTTCGNNSLMAEFTSDGSQVTVRFPMVAGAPHFEALVQSPVAAQLERFITGATPPTPISGTIRIEDAGGALVLDPATVPFTINGCAVERYVGSFDGFAGTAPDIDSDRPLSVFDGDACQGVWDLTVSDAAGANTGKLLGWSLVLLAQAQATPTAASTSTVTVSATRTLSATPTAENTAPPGSTATATPPTATSTSTVTVSATSTLSATPTAENTAPPGSTATATRLATATGLPTSTATATPSGAVSTPTARPTVGEHCTGDCDGSGEVRINELINGVAIALGSEPLSACPDFDQNASGAVEINELIAAVNNALRGCPGA